MIIWLWDFMYNLVMIVLTVILIFLIYRIYIFSSEDRKGIARV